MKNGLVAMVGATGFAADATGQGTAKTPKWGMIIDLNRCCGCQACVIACKVQNRTVRDEFNTRVLAVEDGMGANARVVFTPVQCNQCEDPPCVKACSANATFKLPNGIVVTDWDKCVPLGNCVSACPYEARFLDKSQGHKVDKCDFCIDRLEKGLLPACVEACDSKARIFGDFNAPDGEFAEYLRKAGLTPRKANLGIKTSVLYVPNRRSKVGGSI
ncbi:MAG: 4Fe-4S dicluster domain-containing protein [Burkholderiales bacterium]|nr:4Fe-4S dicluster domain-containing protein [Burkholderiales bacterium]